MTRTALMKQRLRERSEEYLRLAALEQTRRAHPAGTTAPYRARGGAFWRHVFVPVYVRVPWSVKQTAMQRLGMTAKGWTPPARTTGEPWRPSPGRERPGAGQPPA
jgi:hypothetical protein